MITIEYDHLVGFFVALAVAFFFTPVARRIAVRTGAVDIPKDARRMHSQPMALMGGLAVIVGFLVSAVFSYTLENPTGWGALMVSWRFLGPVAGGIIIVAMGMMDDIKPLRARAKLPFQILAAALVTLSGTRVMAISKPFQDIAIGTSSMMYVVGDVVSYLLTILWIVGVTNAINLIDGLDGLSAGVSGIASLSLFVVAVVKGQPDIALLCIALFGSIVGFLPYNFNPARIFSGSTGAYFMGYMLAVISVSGTMKSVTAISLAIPILVLGLPLFDTLFAMTRRIASGRPIGEGDRGHVHHRLVDMGLSHRMSVAVLYIVSATLGLVSITLADKGLLLAIVLVVLILVFVIGGARNLTEMREMVGEGEPQPLPEDEKSTANQVSAAQSTDVHDLEGAQMNTSKRIKVLTVFGTRPEAVKMCPLVRALENDDRMESVLCVTAQHRQMLDQVLEIFQVKPDYDLDIMKDRQTLTGITTRALEGLFDVLEKERPDIVLVHGDTTTTFVAGLAAFYQQVKVGHVEAGLRTWDRYSPFPEEMNRKLTGSLANLHFSPTAANRENLLREGIADKDIFVTGNTVIDALSSTVREDYEFSDPFLATFDFQGKRVILVTAHRRENLGEPLRDICHALRDVVEAHEDVSIIYPVHLNPVVRDTAEEILGGHPRVHLIAPVDVQDMHNLMARVDLVMTDSGGLQEEAPSLGKPVLVLRRETERPEAVAAGTVRLVGTDREEIRTVAAELLQDGEVRQQMARAVNPYGDGHACLRILDALAWHFGLAESPPKEFQA